MLRANEVDIAIRHLHLRRIQMPDLLRRVNVAVPIMVRDVAQVRMALIVLNTVVVE